MTNPHPSHISHEPALCQPLRREYLQGATYKALAEKYQIDQRTAKRLCCALQEADGRECKRTWKLACGFAKDELVERYARCEDAALAGEMMKEYCELLMEVSLDRDAPILYNDK